jgi:hypothetical protein
MKNWILNWFSTETILNFLISYRKFTESQVFVDVLSEKVAVENDIFCIGEIQLGYEAILAVFQGEDDDFRYGPISFKLQDVSANPNVVSKYLIETKVKKNPDRRYDQESVETKHIE